jgi:CO dehydrogenase/acetyl-CoA synthase epsilon subunit
MALPIRLGAVFGVVKEMRATTDRPLLVAGLLAEQLMRELAAGGDSAAVRTGGSPEDVAALLYVIGDEVTEEDERVLKLAHRARVPTIVIAAGRETPLRIPFARASSMISSFELPASDARQIVR